ncbi:hypothetical protein Amsp01_008380 [Amycolatopsis sp. NBRC 101858]|nr:hypothetical protein Amsp01_008380 [Amycolatopsis sp. NBRC 101858]
MRSPGSNGDPEISSDLLDLGAMPLSVLRAYDSAALRRSLRHAVERTAHIPVTASSSGGAKRVD